jgi:hypothetical protein
MTPKSEFTQEDLRHRKWEDGEDWRYCVGDDPYAVSLSVRVTPAPIRAYDMSWHKKGTEITGCLYLSGADCDCDGTGLGAHEWYSSRQVNGSLVPDEEVFEMLRRRYEDWK